MKVRVAAKDLLDSSARQDWVDHGRRPYVKGDTAYIPVREGCAFDCELPDRAPYSGRGYFMMGDVAVLHGRMPSDKEIKGIINFRHPKGILLIHSLNDCTRTPDTKILYGEVGDVQHKENGFTYVLDPQRVMFAQGNREEKRRMAECVKRSGHPERVADMYAGIGYFTIPMAGSGAFVDAMEINPVAFEYLKKNIFINNLSDHVQASCGDCRNLLSGVYDRIVMGHFDSLPVLPLALRHVRQGGVIHLHSCGTIGSEIRSLLAGAGFSAEIHVHKVKKYRPHTWHMVWDIVVG
ncbi:MAG: SAM-dependent methyltransferase [Methanoregula sp.]|nr:MAG: SAM-dependent methyltransferase [Methanoregula sp.]